MSDGYFALADNNTRTDIRSRQGGLGFLTILLWMEFAGLAIHMGMVTGNTENKCR